MAVGSFGEFTLGTPFFTWENTIVGNAFEPPDDGSMISINAFARVSTSAKDFKGAIYDSSKNILGSTEVVNFPVGSQWMELSFIGAQITPITSGVSYWLLAWGESGGGDFTEYDQSSVGDTEMFEAEAFGVWPGDLGSAATFADVVATIYGKYNIAVVAQAFSYIGSEFPSFTDSVIKESQLNKSESYSFSVSKTLSAALNKVESFSFADSVTVSQVIVRAFAETLEFTDSLIKGIQLGKVETLTITDSLTKVHDAIRTFSETLSISDSIAKEAQVKLTETLTFIDSLIKDVSLNKSETLSLADSVALVRNIFKTLSETLTIADSVTTSRVLNITQSETLQIRDFLKLVKQIGGSLADEFNKILTDDVRDTFSVGSIFTDDVRDGFTRHFDVL